MKEFWKNGKVKKLGIMENGKMERWNSRKSIFIDCNIFSVNG